MVLVLQILLPIPTLMVMTVFCDTFGLFGNGNSLQGAINAASNGDTILVPSGTYTESILIMKTLKKGEN